MNITTVIAGLSELKAAGTDATAVGTDTTVGRADTTAVGTDTTAVKTIPQHCQPPLHGPPQTVRAASS